MFCEIIFGTVYIASAIFNTEMVKHIFLHLNNFFKKIPHLGNQAVGNKHHNCFGGHIFKYLSDLRVLYDRHNQYPELYEIQRSFICVELVRDANSPPKTYLHRDL